MNVSNKKLSKQTVVNNELGLHARPAAQIAEIARTANHKVWILKDEERVDAVSIIDILTLACFKGTKVTVEIQDASDAAVLEKVIALFERGFGE